MDLVPWLLTMQTIIWDTGTHICHTKRLVGISVYNEPNAGRVTN